MKRLCAVLLAFALLQFGARADERYVDKIDAGGGAFFAYVNSVEKEFGSPDDFGGVYEKPLIVYVDAEGRETISQLG